MSEEISKRYAQRGVSAAKEDVHNAIKDIDKGLFPKAFCKIVPDHLTQDEDYCLIMHADGAGTKSSLAYMYWKETGDLSVWKGIAQDALIMNIDDLICVGATDDIGAEAVDVAHPIRDFHVTLLHLLGLDDNKLTYFHGGRYKQLSQFGGQVIKELLA